MGLIKRKTENLSRKNFTKKLLERNNSKADVKKIIKETKKVSMFDLVPVLCDRLKQYPEEEKLITDFIEIVRDEYKDIEKQLAGMLVKTAAEVEDAQKKYGLNVDTSIFD